MLFFCDKTDEPQSGIVRATAREGIMTRKQLGESLNHLGPGASLTVEPGVLTDLFGSGSLTGEVLHASEAFAEEHRCTVTYNPHGHLPTFEKDDVF